MALLPLCGAANWIVLQDPSTSIIRRPGGTYEYSCGGPVRSATLRALLSACMLISANWSARMKDTSNETGPIRPSSGPVTPKSL
jgi:hypothetical protein